MPVPPERVISDVLRKFGLCATLFDDAEHVAPGYLLSRKPVILVQRLKYRRARLIYGRDFEVGVEILLRLVMQRDELLLVALFKEPQPRALALQAVIAALEFQHRADAGEGIGHGAMMARSRRPLTSATTLAPRCISAQSLPPA